MTQDEEIRRGKQAERILGDDLYQESFRVIRDELVAQWKDAPARDNDGRERLWVMVKLLDKLEGHLKMVVETGKLATKQVADIQEQNRISRWINGIT